MNLSHYEKFLSIENFQLAFVRLSTASRNFYKTIYYEDLKIFELFLQENLRSVINLVRQGIYTPEQCHKIFVPKKDYFVRPLSMLTFIDLLVYQALVNVIADQSYDLISPFYDNIIFGNQVNPSTANSLDNKFFFKSWKKRWKRFNEVSKDYHSRGYKFISEFDIASFFDTIDHSILCQILKNTFKIDEELLELLARCLETWTADSNHTTFKSKHGIPQGPISSPFLADLYLFHLDSEIKTIKSLDYKYLRYVDDIRILTKDKITSKKIIAALDLYSRDLGLIPQASKILIKEVENVEKELKVQNSKFSDIVKEYKEQNEGKPLRTLKSKTHRRLKKRFLNCFCEGTDEIKFDKTVISFALYKLNKDDEVKKILLENFHQIIAQTEPMFYYLQTHYNLDEDVLKFITSLLNDDNILFHHIIALCFKYFPNIPFDEEVYSRYTFEKHRHWLVNYFMVKWLHNNKKRDLILTSSIETNHFISRELNNYKFLSSDDHSYRRIFSSKLLESQNALIALQGITLLFNESILLGGIKSSKDQNHFVKYIFTNQPSDIINYTIKNIWKIPDSDSFFNDKVWTDDQVYEELKASFYLFIKSIGNDPSKALLNLNGFNNLIFDKVCEVLGIRQPHDDYGVNLKSALMAEYLPVCNAYWIEINEKRNQRTDAHPYDKFGNIRLRITSSEFNDLLAKQQLAVAELCEFRGFTWSVAS